MSQTVTETVTISNSLGLHARPAMLFVETASRYRSDISVRRTDNAEPVDGKSIMQLMMLAATKGTDIQITAAGSDAPKAVQALIELIRSNFNEE